MRHVQALKAARERGAPELSRLLEDQRRAFGERESGAEAPRDLAEAVGGVKPGLALGASDELGFNATEDKVHVHDLNATILHLLGLDHTKLTYRLQGRDFRLTDVHGHLVNKVLA